MTRIFFELLFERRPSSKRFLATSQRVKAGETRVIIGAAFGRGASLSGGANNWRFSAAAANNAKCPLSE